MKAVLMSIQPKWCELIASGKKTVEIRKRRPNLAPPFKVHIYCTKGNLALLRDDGDTEEKYKYEVWEYAEFHQSFGAKILGGKVIGEFVCNQIDTYDDDTIHAFSHEDYSKWNDFDLYNSCIHPEDFERYANDNWLYGWHISNLKIYDEPKGLYHFFKPCGDCDKKGTRRCTEEISDCRAKTITRPPQSWCYVEETEGDNNAERL